MMARLSGILVACMVVGSIVPAQARAEEPLSDLEQVLIESANTPREHAALAEHFEMKAAEMRREAERHRKMGRSYGGQDRITRYFELKPHCDELAALQEEMAKKYDALAAGHKAEAGR